jgi:hypothetical protein
MVQTVELDSQQVTQSHHKKIVTKQTTSDQAHCILTARCSAWLHSKAEIASIPGRSRCRRQLKNNSFSKWIGMQRVCIALLAILAVASATVYFEDKFADGEFWTLFWKSPRSSSRSARHTAPVLRIGLYHCVLPFSIVESALPHAPIKFWNLDLTWRFRVSRRRLDQAVDPVLVQEELG